METISYLSSILTFYIKGEITIDQNFVKLKTPNFILSLIPLGSRKESIPVNQIASTASNFRLRFSKLLLGIILAIMALSMLTQKDGFVMFFFFGILAAIAIIYAFEAYLTIDTTSGQRRVIYFLIFEKEKALQAERSINVIIEGRLNDTNTSHETDRIVEAINNK